MIKRYAIKKIIVTSFCVLLLLMFYFFPINNSFDMTIEKTNDTHESVVYLLDKDNYVSRVTVYFDEGNIEEEVKNKIDTLINGNVMLDNFYTLIPKNTKINSVKIDKNKVYIDFSKELLNVNKYLEESMLESIVYSITEINGLNEVYLSVDGNKLLKSPNYNHNLNYPLTRSIGINKDYNLTSFDKINKTTVFFSKTDDNINYYVPVTKITNSSEDKVQIIIEELKSTINSQNNLESHLNDNTKLVSFNIDEDKMNLVFNDYILSNNEIDEEVSYNISNSIFENYKVNEIVFNTSKEKNILVIKK